MFCESWRETLSEAAANGEAVPREAQAHLAVCGSCRAALAAEQQLFASMESGLRSITNAEVPMSLLPRVRAVIAGASSEPAWRLPAWALAAAAVVIAIVALSAATFVSRSKVQPAKATVANNASSPAAGIQPNESSLRAAPPSEPPTFIRSDRSSLRTAADSEPQVQIVVAPEEQLGLQRYIKSLSENGEIARAKCPAAFADIGTEIEPLKFAAVDLKELSIAPLDSGDSR